jgi:hypothetical protein
MAHRSCKDSSACASGSRTISFSDRWRTDPYGVVFVEGHPLSRLNAVTLTDLDDFEFIAPGTDTGDWLTSAAYLPFRNTCAKAGLSPTTRMRGDVRESYAIADTTNRCLSSIWWRERLAW